MLSSLTAMASDHREFVGYLTDADLPSLRQALSAVPDPRHRRGVRYVFTELLLVCVAAVLSGAKSLTMIAEWGAEARHRQVLSRWTRTPSVATLHRVIAALDPVVLDTVISSWITRCAAAGTSDDASVAAIAVDGKEVRGAKHGGGHKVFLMAALDHRTGTVAAQEPVGEKTNEIPHLPTLLKRLSGPDNTLTSTVITADALHTHAQQAEAITARGGHYLFTVKTNAKALHAQIASASWARRAPQYRAREKAHGRTSSWEATVINAPARIDFPKASQIIRIQRGRAEHGGEDTGEIVYAITSLPPEKATAEDLATLLRGHWGIENRLHWIRDTAFAEDASQIRTGNAAHVMASLRNLAISILRLAGHTNITAALRHYGRDPHLAAELTRL